MEYKVADDLNIEKEVHKKWGCDYTPEAIAVTMAKKLKWDGKGDIIEPCVGAGNLLLALITEYGEEVKQHFYGVDILEQNINYCKKTWPEIAEHFKVGNCLEDPITEEWWWTGKPKPFKFGI
jgi:tRNA1(Val) A37 N6-methylase TrmN6